MVGSEHLLKDRTLGPAPPLTSVEPPASYLIMELPALSTQRPVGAFSHCPFTPPLPHGCQQLQEGRRLVDLMFLFPAPSSEPGRPSGCDLCKMKDVWKDK